MLRSMNAPSLAMLSLSAFVAACGSTILAEEAGGAAAGTSTSGTTGSGGGAATGSGGAPACAAAPWNRRFGNGHDDQYGLGVVVDGDCNVVVAGMVDGPVDLGGGVE